ncbi:hypothetical protein [Blastococcus sp. SYSU DS0617]
MAQIPAEDQESAARRWYRSLPRTTKRVVAAGLVAGWLALWYVSMYALDGWLDDEGPDWTAPVPGMVGGLAGIGGVLWWQRRRMGSFRRMGEYERALKRGRLSDDADPAEWGPLLQRAQRFQRGARPLAVGVTALSAVVVVVLMLWVGLGWGIASAAAGVGAVAVAVVEVSSRRQTARIDRLAAQLPADHAQRAGPRSADGS